MEVIKYRTELDENLHNILVEESREYCVSNIMNTPEKLFRLMADTYRLNRQAEEHLYMISLNSKCSILGVFEIAHGQVNSCQYTPREIFIRALLCGAASIVLIHNHPSQDTTPSEADLKAAQNMNDACKMMGLSLTDFIIVGEKYLSFREEGYLQ